MVSRSTRPVISSILRIVLTTVLKTATVSVSLAKTSQAYQSSS